MEKRNTLRVCLMWLFALALAPGMTAQTTYTYPLEHSFSGIPAGQAPDLIPLANDAGQTGHFVLQNIPSTTCPNVGTAPGYYFEDDAGLQFNNPPGFISCAYTLKLAFHFDDFLGPPLWIRLLSFTHTNDFGMFIQLTNAPSQGTLSFWPFGIVGTPNFFNSRDFYQMIIVRDCSGYMAVYVNGTYFGTFYDGFLNMFVPQPPNNYLVFFRDHPLVLADEASPGFVADISISNYVWSAAEITQAWENFCPVLLPVEVQELQASLQGRQVGLQAYLRGGQAVDAIYVERRQEGRAFEQIGEIGVDSCAASVCSYTYTDASPPAGRQVYRLRIKDLNGQFYYSRQVAVWVGEQGWKVYPNPAGKMLWIAPPAQAGPATYRIRGMLGTTLLQGRLSGPQTTVDLGQLAAGMYVLHIRSRQGEQVFRLQVQP